MNSWSNDEEADASWAGKDAAMAAAAAAAGLFPDDDDWFPGAAMPCDPSAVSAASGGTGANSGAWDTGPVAGPECVNAGSWDDGHGRHGGAAGFDGPWGLDGLVRPWAGCSASAPAVRHCGDDDGEALCGSLDRDKLACAWAYCFAN